MPHNPVPSLLPRLEQSFRARTRARLEDRSDAFWDNYISSFYTPDAEYRLAFVGVTASQLNSFLDTPLALSASSLAKLLQFKYDCGVLDEFLVMGASWHEVRQGKGSGRREG